ncbi:MAG: arginine--tRNA ligase [Candidatus Spechtbacterales bacterium]|nr:arginine--tRNA ligase [Candidatus Spechtbacterales bacterium]
MANTRTKLKRIVKKTIKELQEAGDLPDVKISDVKIERPTREGQGDYATAVALQIGSMAKRKPKTVAKILASALEKNEKLGKMFSEVRVISPGFVNFYFSEEYLRKLLWDSLKKENYGAVNVGKNKKLNLEFISVNPTGELHVGHGRTAFYGDVLANVLSYAGYKVTREYYVNNARQSAQIKELGKTALGKGTSYKSPYLSKKMKQYSKALKRMKNFDAAGYFLAQRIQKDIRTFLEKDAGIEFDVWLEEEELYNDNQVEKTLKELNKKGLTYEEDGAVWLKTTKYGDSQDQVLIRSTGENTYFMADIAYHRNKVRRGFEQLVDIWGADHQGHVKRMKAAMKIFGIKEMEILIAQMVRLKGNVKLSKRKGNVVALKDLLDAVGTDAARYFYLTKSLDTQMEFDLKLAKERSKKNPVYYIQYSHARICSIMKKAENKDPQKKNLNELKKEGEMNLIRKITELPEIIEDTAQDHQVHRLTTYVYELAQEFNQFYRDYRVIGDDEDLERARLALSASAGSTIKQCLDLLGISAPDKM